MVQKGTPDPLVKPEDPDRFVHSFIFILLIHVKTDNNALTKFRFNRTIALFS